MTVVTGRRQNVFQRLRKAGLPKFGSLVGWTDEMPKLMTSHHFFIGKAGGATVQEAIVAQIPFLVSHVVPGQEEGNIALIEQSRNRRLGRRPSSTRSRHYHRSHGQRRKLMARLASKPRRPQETTCLTDDRPFSARARLKGAILSD